MRATSVAAAAVAVALALAAPAARAEDIFRQPGRHENNVEFEFLGLVGYHLVVGVGVGVHVGVPLVQNGPLSGVNNSLALTLGGDLLYCPREVESAMVQTATLFFPLTLQWNFWATTDWSFFVEGGAGVELEVRGSCQSCAPETAVWPVGDVGARWHFRGQGLFPALTFHAGYPGGFAVGMSF